MGEPNKKRKILVVDDEQSILLMFSSVLGKDHFVHTAQGGPEALEMAERHGPYSVVLADMRMPGMSGVDLLAKFREVAPDTVRVLITGLTERQIVIDAVNKSHVFRILAKPCSTVDLHSTVALAVRQSELVLAEKALLLRTVNGGIQALTDLLFQVSPLSFGRGQAVRQGMRQIASYFDVIDTWELEVAAMVARVGEVALPAGLPARVQNQEELTVAEREQWARVPELGSKLLAHNPQLQGVARTVLYQSKNFDGTGFPGDLVAQRTIPLGARLLRGLTDYQLALEAGEKPASALAQLKFSEGAYDPEVLSAIERGLVEASDFAALGITRIACKLRDLRVGQRLAEPVVALDEMLIVQRGVILTDQMLDRIRNFDHQVGLRQPLYIEDSGVDSPLV